MLLGILSWIIFTIFLTAIGSNRKIGGVGAFFISLFLSPLIGLIVVLASEKKIDSELKDKILKKLDNENTRHNKTAGNKNSHQLRLEELERQKDFLLSTDSDGLINDKDKKLAEINLEIEKLKKLIEKSIEIEKVKKAYELNLINEDEFRIKKQEITTKDSGLYQIVSEKQGWSLSTGKYVEYEYETKENYHSTVLYVVKNKKFSFSTYDSVKYFDTLDECIIENIKYIKSK